MKRIAFVTLVCMTIAAVGISVYPDESAQYLAETSTTTQRIWEAVEANPVPVLLALGTFLLTVLFHKARGKSLRESVEVAATRVTLVPVPLRDGAGEENPVLRRAKARATRAQLLNDQTGIQNRQRKFPDEILKAEKESCYTEQALVEAQRTLISRRKAHELAVAKLEALRKERASGEAELIEIGIELRKLSEQV